MSSKVSVISLVILACLAFGQDPGVISVDEMDRDNKMVIAVRQESARRLRADIESGKSGVELMASMLKAIEAGVFDRRNCTLKDWEELFGAMSVPCKGSFFSPVHSDARTFMAVLYTSKDDKLRRKMLRKAAGGDADSVIPTIASSPPCWVLIAEFRQDNRLSKFALTFGSPAKIVGTP